MSKLTGKQESFCQHYIVDLNATQAAIRAGYSKKTASEIGFENLRKPQLQLRIAQLQKKRQEEVKISQEMVIKNIVEDRASAINVDQYSVAMKGNELLGKHLGMFGESAVEREGLEDYLKRKKLQKLEKT